MSKEKWKRDLIEQAVAKDTDIELLEQITIKIPPNKKYKKHHNTDPDLPDLYVGKKAIVRMLDEKRDIKGYMLGQILDYHSGEHFWNQDTTLILQVLRVSHEGLKDHIGHLIAGNYSSDNQDYAFFRNRYAVVSFDQKDYKFL